MSDSLTSEQIKLLESELESRISLWRSEISDLNKKLNNMHSLSDVMSVIYDKRQLACEQRLNIGVNLSRLEARYNERRGALFQQYKMNSQLKLTDGAINTIIDGELSEYTYIMNIFNQYFEHMREVIKTIDGISYAVKSRIEIEELITSKVSL